MDLERNLEGNSCSPRGTDASPIAVESALQEENPSPGRHQLHRPGGEFTASFEASSIKYWSLLTLTAVVLTGSFISASLLGRYYFNNGGTNLWFYTLTQSLAFPVPGCIMVIFRLCHELDYNVSYKSVAAYAGLGLVIAIGNLLYSYSVALLPMSTVGLLGATHVGFLAFFAYLLVKKRFTPFSLNSIVLVSLSAIILELSTKSDKGVVSGHKHSMHMGFIMSILANFLYGLLLPLMELILLKLDHNRIRKEVRRFPQELEPVTEPNLSCPRDKYLDVYILLELQTFTNIFASIFVLIAVMWSGSYLVLKDEMNSFHGGLWRYWVCLVCGAVGWQLVTLATLGMILLSSSLFTGVLTSLNLPLLAFSAVFFFGDSLNELKVVAMVLSAWGFASYLYGGYLETKSQR